MDIVKKILAGYPFLNPLLFPSNLPPTILPINTIPVFIHTSLMTSKILGLEDKDISDDELESALLEAAKQYQTLLLPYSGKPAHPAGSYSSINWELRDKTDWKSMIGKSYLFAFAAAVKLIEHNESVERTIIPDQTGTQQSNVTTMLFKSTLESYESLVEAHLLATSSYEILTSHELSKSATMSDKLIRRIEDLSIELERKRVAPVETWHDENSRKLRRHAIDLWQSGTFKSMRQASFQLVDVLDEFARKNSIRRLVKTNAQRTIYEWLLMANK